MTLEVANDSHKISGGRAEHLHSKASKEEMTHLEMTNACTGTWAAFWKVRSTSVVYMKEINLHK